MALTLAPEYCACKYARKINGVKIGEGDVAGYDVRIYRASTGRITIRCSFWHSEQDASREGYLLDHRVSGADLHTAEMRARECGYPPVALLAAISAAEEFGQ